MGRSLLAQWPPFYVQKRPHIAMRSQWISARVGRCLLYYPQRVVFYEIHYKLSFAVVKNLHGIRSQMFIQLFVKGEHGFTVQRVVGDQ